jgi:hypothetical protein
MGANLDRCASGDSPIDCGDVDAVFLVDLSRVATDPITKVSEDFVDERKAFRKLESCFGMPRNNLSLSRRPR